MATPAEQAVIDMARALRDEPGGLEAVLAEHWDGLGHALDALDAEQAPVAPYAVGSQCAYLDHHNWLVATVESVEAVPARPGFYALGLCVRARHGEHRMTKTVDASGVGENVAPLRDH